MSDPGENLDPDRENPDPGAGEPYPENHNPNTFKK